jgi:hypothetical protein
MNPGPKDPGLQRPIDPIWVRTQGSFHRDPGPTELLGPGPYGFKTQSPGLLGPIMGGPLPQT